MGRPALTRVGADRPIPNACNNKKINFSLLETYGILQLQKPPCIGNIATSTAQTQWYLSEHEPGGLLEIQQVTEENIYFHRA